MFVFYDFDVVHYNKFKDVEISSKQTSDYVHKHKSTHTHTLQKK